MAEPHQKIFAGPRLRRLRRERGLTQARMAEDLAISTSYLNLMERDQRPVTAAVLLRLAETFDIDIKAFAGDEEAGALADLQEVFSDPLFEGRISRAELRDIAAASPEASQAIAHLYGAYREAVTNTTEMAERLSTAEGGNPDAAAPAAPADEVRDFLRRAGNYFGELEDAAARLHESASLEPDALYHGLRRHLEDAHATTVSIMPVDVMQGALRRYDRHRRRVLMSELLPAPSRTFQLAYQVALMDDASPIDKLIQDQAFSGREARGLARITLANYLAAALIMPYERFFAAAESLRYDIDILAGRFGVSYEQVCHRLTTLQRPGARGIPFFMIRIDAAGNVSKRFSAAGFQFARLGGACPRWNVHHAFQTPGNIFTQMIRMPDQAAYFSVARTVGESGGTVESARQFAIGLGCDIAHARRIVYADGYDLENLDAATPIGITCRLCERDDCAQRAVPPMSRRLIIDEHRRDASPYSFTGPDAASGGWTS